MSKCDNCIHVGVCHYIMFGDSDEITECRHFNEERPKGKWIKHISSLECSECKVKFFCGDEDENVQDYDPCNELNFNFCPNCGADLREVVNE